MKSKYAKIAFLFLYTYVNVNNILKCQLSMYLGTGYISYSSYYHIHQPTYLAFLFHFAMSSSLPVARKVISMHVAISTK